MIWIHKYIEPCNSPHRMIDVDFLRLMTGTDPWGTPLFRKGGSSNDHAFYFNVTIEIEHHV